MNANKWTDKELGKIEKEIDKIYKKSHKEITKKAQDYFKTFEKQDAEKKALVESGEWTNSQYKNWRQIEMTTGERWRRMQESSAMELTRANERAMAYVNGKLPSVYVQNYNEVKSSVDKIGGYSFDLVNEDAVKYVTQNIDKDLLPHKKVNKSKDIAYNKRRINSEVLQGILQGEDIPTIAGRLQKAGIGIESASIRSARTMVTGAQNRGKLDSYERAQDDGIEIKKQWVATLDDRTREAHGELDGVSVPVDEPFTNSIGDIMFPADPECEDPENVYNCRCTLIADVGQERGKQRMTRDANGKSVLAEDMTYEEWYEAKTGKKLKMEPDIPKSEVRKALEESNIPYLKPDRLTEKLSSMEIAEKLAGGDMTGGSCASLSMAYAANKGGQDVLDFRGGDSMKFFSKGSNLDKIAQLQGVEGYVVRDFNDFKTANELLKNVVEGKEYALGVGKHMAIIRKGESGFEYLEMQSAKGTGFRKLDNNTLKWRFGCQKNHSLYGTKYKISGELIEVESLGNNPEFQKMTGYLNTAVGKQQKGVLGGIK